MIEKIKIENNNFNKEIILKSYIEKYSDDLKKKYLDLVYNFSNIQIKNKKLKNQFNVYKNHNLWEMSLIHEKNTLKSKSIYSVIKFIACYDLIKKYKKKRISFYLEDQILINSLKELSEQKNLLINFKISKKIYFSQFSILSSIFRILKFIIKNCFFVKSKNFENLNSEIMILSYFAHYKIKKNNFIFSAWDGIEKVIDKNKLSWLQIFIESNKFRSINSVSKNEKLDQNKLNFIENYLSVKILIKVIFCYLKLFVKNFFLLKKIKAEKKNLLKFLIKIQENDILESFIGFNMFQNLIWIFLFENILSNISKKKLGFYLFENQNWEKAFINAWKNNNHGKIIGYTPTTINYWHLNYFHSKKELNSNQKKIIPDIILSNSNYNTNQLKKFNLYKIKVKEVEALRYNKLFKLNYDNFKIKNSNKVIFLGDYLDDVNDDFLKFFFKNKFKNKLKLYVKPHPSSLFFFKDKIKKKYNFKIIKYPLKKIATKFYKIISSNSTSAGIEYLMSGRPIFIFDNKKYFDLSPFKNSNLTYLTDINQIINFNKKKYLNHKYKDFYFINNGLRKWKKLIKEIN